MTVFSSRRRAALVALGTLALGGCVVAPVSEPRRPAPGPGYGEEEDRVLSAPPPPRYEVVGVAPFIGAIWFAGFWAWISGRWVWRPGYWGPPRQGYRWVPQAWIRIGPGWQSRPGHWSRH